MQLAFDLKLHSEATFENFVVGSNEIVVDVLKKMAVGNGGHLNCFIWSQSVDGLSHLLQAVCHHATQHAVENLYLPLAELKSFGPTLLIGVEAVPVVCLDDVDCVAGDAAWEEALFHAFNRIREKEGRLIVGAHHAVIESSFHLQDLISRLAWGVSYKLHSLDDAEKMALLQLSAKRRGFHLPRDVVKYLLTHYPRDFRTQFNILEKLDALSLQEKHKITLPFVKLVLKNETILIKP